MSYGLWAISWTEHERGWGQSDFGIEVFATIDLANKKIDETMKGRSINNVPDYYISPSRPYFLEVTKEQVDEAQKKGSFWLR